MYFKNQIMVQGRMVSGLITTEQYEDYEPHHSYFEPKFLTSNPLDLNSLESLIYDLKQVRDQMVAVEASLNLNREEEEND